MTNGFDLMRMWTRSVFGFVVGVAMFFIFNSLFLGLITIAFLCFIPRSAAGTTFIFGGLMILLLGLAFVNSSSLGLGLDLGTTSAPGVPVTLFFVAISFFVLAAAITRPVWQNITIQQWMGVPPGAGAPRIVGILNIVGAVFLLISLAWGFISGTFHFWTWNSSAILFFFIWAASMAVGLNVTPAERSTLGVIVIVFSFLIFTFGIGQQEVGQAIFLQWWPAVNDFVGSITAPIADIFSQLSSTFQNTIFLITNPVGFAQSITNGSFTLDPTTGLRGAFGVEMEDFRISPVYIEQPYLLTFKINNKGAVQAKDVKLTISSGYRAPTTGLLSSRPIKIQELGFKENGMKCEPNGEYCSQQVAAAMPKLGIEQIFFNSEGINCKTSEEFDLREKSIPINGTLEYKYSVNSQLQIEMMSQAEWDRLVRDGKIVVQNKKQSEISNSPVRLNIDTLEQPIREKTDFFIGINLVSAQGSNTWVSDPDIGLEVPEEFQLVGECGSPSGSTNGFDSYHFGPDFFKGKSGYIAFCRFRGVEFKPEWGRSHTFLVKAAAGFTFRKTQTKNTKIEFGGIDCKTKIPTDDLKGRAGYCEEVKRRTTNGCRLGAGGCNSDSVCEGTFGATPKNLICVPGIQSAAGVGAIGVCCPEGSPSRNCQSAHNQWFKTPGDDIATATAFNNPP